MFDAVPSFRAAPCCPPGAFCGMQVRLGICLQSIRALVLRATYLDNDILAHTIAGHKNRVWARSIRCTECVSASRADAAAAVVWWASHCKVDQVRSSICSEGMDHGVLKGAASHQVQLMHIIRKSTHQGGTTP